MLEQFHVSEAEAVRVNHDALRDTVAAVFERVDVPEKDARQAADVLVLADLRGVETHGVSNMLRTYVGEYRSGQINPHPKYKVLRETRAAANFDSDGALGIISTPLAMEMAIEKAKDAGVGMVTIMNGRHLGMASYYAMMALEHDMIGVCVTSCGPSVLPTFASLPRMGTNPIAVAAPAGEEPPFVFDAATSSIAGNKVGLARRVGALLSPGWMAAGDGTPIMEPMEAPEGNHLPWLLPVGSTREQGSHKGYGLACIVDILGGILSGGGFGMFPGRPHFHHMVAAYRVEAFTDVVEFKGMMDDFLRLLKATPPTPGQERVIVAGQPEWEEEQERRARGIPLHKEVVGWFRETCAEMEIPYTLEG